MNQPAHSSEFIAEMKKRLIEERTTLQQDLTSLAHTKGTPGSENYEANFPEYGRNDEENVTETADFLALQSTTETLEERLKEIEAALQRIEAGTYGITETGELIPEERLQANPAAADVVKPKQ